MPHKHGRRVKRKTQQESEQSNAEEKYYKAPKTFVLSRYKVEQNVKDLINDMRKLFYPNTALKLQTNEKQKLPDVIQTANHFKVSNLVFFKQSQKNEKIVMKIAKLPKGPTFNFKVQSFKNSSQCQGKHINIQNLKNQTAPVLITNKKLKKFPQVLDCIQKLFPSIDPIKTNPKICKRVCLFTRNSGKMFSLRHYLIKTQVSGINRAVKKIIKHDTNLNNFNFSRYDDISQLILENEGYQTESEGEVVGKMEMKEKEKISIRLIELGPRIDFKLYKIQSGFCQGEQIKLRKVSKNKKQGKMEENEQQDIDSQNESQNQEDDQNSNQDSQQEQDIQNQEIEEEENGDLEEHDGQKIKKKRKLNGHQN